MLSISAINVQRYAAAFIVVLTLLRHCLAVVCRPRVEGRRLPEVQPHGASRPQKQQPRKQKHLSVARSATRPVTLVVRSRAMAPDHSGFAFANPLQALGRSAHLRSALGALVRPSRPRLHPIPALS